MWHIWNRKGGNIMPRRTQKMKLKFGIFAIGSALLSIYLMKQYKEKELKNYQNRINVLSDHFQLLNHWLEVKHEGKHISSYFEEMNYKHIAVYGMAELANRLSEELKESSVVIDYGIDRDISCSIARIDAVYYPEDELPAVDAVVVTPYSSFKDIKTVLEKKMNCPILSLENIIWSM